MLTTIAINVVISLCADMANFVELLSEQSRSKWAQLYKRIIGREWTAQDKPGRGIECETKIESLEEIDKLMREVPNPTRRE